MPIEEPFSLVFDFNVLRDTKRLIKGVAAVPTVDREKEIILKSALESAVKGFMELPVVHFNHTERPIGMVTHAEVRSDGLHIIAVIREQNGSDEIWKGIKSGKYGKFSIFGRRVKASPECRLSPVNRDSPCVTEALYLDSISIVESDAAINQDTWLTVVKGYIDTIADNYISSETIQNQEGRQMVEIEPEQIEKKCNDTEPVEKSDTESSDMLSLLTEIKNILMSLVPKEEPAVTKAEPATIDIDSIVKARIGTELEEIHKSVLGLEARITKMEEETIKKGSEIVIIPPDGEMYYGNASALKKFEEGAK